MCYSKKNKSVLPTSYKHPSTQSTQEDGSRSIFELFDVVVVVAVVQYSRICRGRIFRGHRANLHLHHDRWSDECIPPIHVSIYQCSECLDDRVWFGVFNCPMEFLVDDGERYTGREIYDHERNSLVWDNNFRSFMWVSVLFDFLRMVYGKTVCECFMLLDCFTISFDYCVIFFSKTKSWS